MRVAKFRKQVCGGSLDELYRRPETTAAARLDELGFSERFRSSFLTPFLSGIFLEDELSTSSRMLDFVFRMFSMGDAALPSGGMEAIPRQLAETLPSGCVRLNTRVAAASPQSVHLENGERLEASTVVLATSASAAAELLQLPKPARGRRVACLYFSLDQPPITEPILVLNGDGKGPINNLCFPSQVVSSYSPSDKLYCRLACSKRTKLSFPTTNSHPQSNSNCASVWSHSRNVASAAHISHRRGIARCQTSAAFARRADATA